MRRLLVDGSAIVVRGLGGIVQFLVILILGRVYGAEVVGYYGFGIAILVLSGTLLSVGFPGYLVMRNSVRFDEGSHGVFRSNARHAAGVSLAVGIGAQLVMIGVLIVAGAWIRDHNVGHRILAWAPLTGAAMGVVLVMTYTLRARNQALIANVIDRPFLHLITLGAFALLGARVASQDLRVLFAIGIGVSATALVAWAFAFRGLSIGPTTDTARDPVDTRHLSAYLLSIFVDIVLARSPLVVGSFFFTAIELGSFQVAFSLAASVIVLQEALGGIIGPRVAVLASRGDVPGVLRLHHRTQLLLVVMVLPLLLGLAFFSEEALVLVNPELGDAALALRILILGISVRCAAGIYRSIFEATGAMRFAVYTGGVAIAVLLVTITAFADRGATGLATAWASATIAHAVVGFVLCEYALRTGIPKRAEAT